MFSECFYIHENIAHSWAINHCTFSSDNLIKLKLHDHDKTPIVEANYSASHCMQRQLYDAFTFDLQCNKKIPSLGSEIAYARYFIFES